MVDQSQDEAGLICCFDVASPLASVMCVFASASTGQPWSLTVCVFQHKVVGPRENGDATSSPTEPTPTQENPPFWRASFFLQPETGDMTRVLTHLHTFTLPVSHTHTYTTLLSGGCGFWLARIPCSTWFLHVLSLERRFSIEHVCIVPPAAAAQQR